MDAVAVATSSASLQWYPKTALSDSDSDESLATPTDHRLYLVAKALALGYSVERVWDLSRIDRWFLSKMKNITDHANRMSAMTTQISAPELRYAKQIGFCDSQIAQCLSVTSLKVRQLRESQGITPVVKLIDTVAGEFPAVTIRIIVQQKKLHNK